MEPAIPLALLTLITAAAAGKIPPPFKNEEGQNWAVLVAGSNGWFNYRHQSDICHAYHVLHDQGIPDERIIVMMYDDIAYNELNLQPGKIYNNYNYTNVYLDVPKDYTGKEVIPEVFLDVLQGNEEAVQWIGSGKVVKSGPNDRIFVNLDGLGAMGLFSFPTSELMANELAEVIENMYASGKYKEMMIYLEASNSGSMFEDFYDPSLNVYALSAASPTESSWSTYCKAWIHICLGNEFGVSWMEDTDKNDPATETLETQFQTAKDRTLGSTVMQWGNLNLAKEMVATFFGPPSNVAKDLTYKHTKASSIRAQDVPLVMLEQKLKSAKNDSARTSVAEEIAELKERREFVQTTMENIALSVTSDKKLSQEMMVNTSNQVTNWSCYSPVVHAFSDNCFNLGQSTFALTTVHTLAHLCEEGYTTGDITRSIETVCSFPTIYNAI